MVKTPVWILVTPQSYALMFWEPNPDIDPGDLVVPQGLWPGIFLPAFFTYFETNKIRDQFSNGQGPWQCRGCNFTGGCSHLFWYCRNCPFFENSFMLFFIWSTHLKIFSPPPGSREKGPVCGSPCSGRPTPTASWSSGTVAQASGRTTA